MKTIFILIIGFCLCTFTFSQDKKAFLKECQKSNEYYNGFSTLIWLPNQFWEISYDSISDENFKKSASDFFSKYVCVIAKNFEMKNPPKMIPSDSTTITENLFLFADDIKISAESYSNLSDNDKKVYTILKAIFVGSNEDYRNDFYLLIFKTKQAKSFTYNSKKSIQFRFYDNIMEWKTPFSSTLEPKYCPIDNEKLAGTTLKCEKHNAKVVDKPINYFKEIFITKSYHKKDKLKTIYIKIDSMGNVYKNEEYKGKISLQQFSEDMKKLVESNEITYKSAKIGFPAPMQKPTSSEHQSIYFSLRLKELYDKEVEEYKLFTNSPIIYGSYLWSNHELEKSEKSYPFSSYINAKDWKFIKSLLRK